MLNALILYSKELATRQDMTAIKHDLAVMEEQMTSNLYKAMLVQTFAIARLVVVIVKLIGN